MRNNLLPVLESSLTAFLSAGAKFRVLETVSTQLSSSTTLESGPRSPRTLLILDSSFNPPTRAHLSMATSALKDYLTDTSQSPDVDATSTPRPIRQTFQPPYRILLLFSVHNADKSPSPAAFPHRLALMYMSAIDMLSSLSSSLPLQSHQDQLSVDVAVTKEPFYSDKSAAIDATDAYSSDERHKPRHIHLIGHDTFVRFLNPKYYSSFRPPLSALDPFFRQHGLRLTLRASSPEEADEQRRTWENLAEGGLEKDGGRKEWANLIETVHGKPETVDVSSTAVRKACESRDWKLVEEICPRQVARWVIEHGLYQGDLAGKM